MKYINWETLTIASGRVTGDKWLELPDDHPILSVNSKYWKQRDNDYPEEMTPAEKEPLQVAEAKQEKIAEIVNNTENFINAGFEHPDNNLIKFGLNTMWASNWNAIRADFLDEENPNDNFPYEVGTLDGEDYFIANYQEFKNIYKAGKDRKKYLIKGQRMLLQQVKQADTVAEVEAITDNRV